MAPLPRRAPTLTDGVVTLRAHRDDDIDAVVEQCRDPDMQHWTTVPVPYSRDDAATFVRHVVPGGWEVGDNWEFAVTARDDDGLERFVGSVGLRDRGTRRAEIGFGTHPAHRRRGHTERACRLLLEWGLEEQGLEVVHWVAKKHNWGSRRIAWRLGFDISPGRHFMDQRDELHPAWFGTLVRGEPLEPRHPWYDVPVLRGERVVLRPLRDADLPRVVETLNDAEVQRWQARPREQAPHTTASQADFVADRHEQAAAGTAFHLAVADPGSDAYLGQMSLFSVLHRREATVSYWTHPDARGRGLTQEAARMTVRHCFVPWDDGGLGLRRLWADADVRNGASRRVLERTGFVETGLDRASEPTSDGGWADVVRFDLLAEEWRDPAPPDPENAM